MDIFDDLLDLKDFLSQPVRTLSLGAADALRSRRRALASPVDRVFG
jgi:ABC-type uncharacterized transport system ATPase subunit